MAKKVMKLPVFCQIITYDQFDRIGILETSGKEHIRFGESACTDFAPKIGVNCWLVKMNEKRNKAALVNLTGKMQPTKFEQTERSTVERTLMLATQKKKRAENLQVARRTPDICLNAIEKCCSIELPQLYKKWVLEQRTNSNQKTYLWLPEVCWIEPMDIPSFDFGMPSVIKGLVPFATTPSGDYWCWWPQSKSQSDEPEILLCCHDFNEAEVFAPNVASWLFRVAMTWGTEIDEPGDCFEARTNLRFWAQLLKIADNDSLYNLLFSISKNKPQDYPYCGGTIKALVEPSKVDSIITKSLGNRYLNTKLKWLSES